ncbi:uncharacterized protein LOC130654254 isoform X1 [Hydractinia symbiolongicarpus]|uniref:uncharacterized protein LOC130654254 isoform X1 n=2 Tax=Hydractinia symbiolongicarpus TaxID=13093 RepID=UPI00254ED98C|nr:uncharacterized protein LOC130654254 isoform X1 [Hydractinia symbiolongicarpus]
MAKPTKIKQDSNTFNRKKGSSNPDRPKPAIGSKMRDRATIKRIKMYKGGKPVRDRSGKIIVAAEYQNRVKSGEVARVEPNRKWFGNTKVISQNALQTFQDEMGKAISNPYKVVMKASKLPLSLLNDRKKTARVHLLDTETFENTFGPKSHRKRPVLSVNDVAGLAMQAEGNADKYNKDNDLALVENNNIEEKTEVRDPKFSKGQSKRIWNELYKVIDSSDVVIQVLDARDPPGTRSKHIEEFMQREKKHKHLIFILNKCDLVPTWVTRRWVAALSVEYPTLAFHASVTNPFGKGALIQLLRQFGKLHQDKKNISVGFIGYPNVGKSSIINTLKKKKVCKTAPIPGETKVWQYVTLMRKIYLIDCPGVVYPSGDTETEIVLKGVVRVENIKEPWEHIEEVLTRVKKEYLQKTYKILNWENSEDFLEKFCRQAGRLLKGGEPDINTVAKMILNDFQRGRLPYFVPPPKIAGEDEKNVASCSDLNKISTIDFIPETNKEMTAPSVTQNFDNLTVLTEFDKDDGDVMLHTSKLDLDNIKKDIEEKEYSDLENDSGSDNEENVDEGGENAINNKSQIVDSEISFNYFDKAKKKFKLKTEKYKHKIEADQESDDSEPYDSDVSEQFDINSEEELDKEKKPNEKKNSDTEETVEADLINSLTSEERSFLGLGNDTNQQEQTDDAGKYKIVSSPGVLCVEAMSDSNDDQTNKGVKRTSKKRKLKRVHEEEEDKKNIKPKRMTTNKMKTGSRYYEEANVKNKNKQKKNKTMTETLSKKSRTKKRFKK